MEHNTEFQNIIKSETASDNDQFLSDTLDIKEESTTTLLVIDGNLVNKNISIQDVALPVPILDVKEEPLDQNWVISDTNKNIQDATLFENQEIKSENSDGGSYKVFVTNYENLVPGKKSEKFSAIFGENDQSYLNDNGNDTKKELDLIQADELEPNVYLVTKTVRNNTDEPNKCTLNTSKLINDDITSKSASEDKQITIRCPKHNYSVYHTVKYDQQVYRYFCSVCKAKFVDCSSFLNHTKFCLEVAVKFCKYLTDNTKSPKTNVNLPSCKKESLTNPNHAEPGLAANLLMSVPKPQTLDVLENAYHNKLTSLHETKLSSVTAVNGKISVNPTLPAGKQSSTSVQLTGSDKNVKTPPDIRVLSSGSLQPPVGNRQGAANNLQDVGTVRSTAGNQQSTACNLQHTVDNRQDAADNQQDVGNVKGTVGNQQYTASRIQGTVFDHDKTPGNQQIANNSFGRVNQMTKTSAEPIKCLYCFLPISLVNYEEHLQNHLDCINLLHKSETEMVENIGLLYLHFAKCDLDFSVRKCKSETCHYIFLTESETEKHYLSHHVQPTQSGSNEKMEAEFHDTQTLENACNNQHEPLKSARLLQNMKTTPTIMTQVKNKNVFEPPTSPRQVQKRKR